MSKFLINHRSIFQLYVCFNLTIYELQHLLTLYTQLILVTHHID